jgi:hypothetical protein
MTTVARTHTSPVPMAALTVLLALSMAAAGCMNDKRPTVPICNDCDGPYRQQTSPARILANLQVAYRERNVAEYRKLLADDFTFVFSPADTVGDDPTPSQWGLADDLQSTGNMFTDSLVDRIELTSYVLGVPERADSLLYGPRAWKVRVDAASFQVWTRNEAHGTLVYLVEGTTEVLYFRTEPSRPASDGKPSWFIFRWEDLPIGSAKVAKRSWGAIKFLFR